MRTPSSRKCRLDLAPPLADRFILGSPIDYGPVLLLMPFGFRLTVDTLPSGGQQVGAPGQSWPVSGFRLRAVGIELRRACCRWRVTSLALSIARWDLISTMANGSGGPPIIPDGRITQVRFETLAIFCGPS